MIRMAKGTLHTALNYRELDKMLCLFASCVHSCKVSCKKNVSLRRNSIRFRLNAVEITAGITEGIF